MPPWPSHFLASLGSIHPSSSVVNSSRHLRQLAAIIDASPPFFLPVSSFPFFLRSSSFDHGFVIPSVRAANPSPSSSSCRQLSHEPKSEGGYFDSSPEAIFPPPPPPFFSPSSPWSHERPPRRKSTIIIAACGAQWMPMLL